MARTKALIGVTLITIATLTACAPTSNQSEELAVVATTSILGDIVKSVVGSDGSVSVIIPNGSDPHEFRASPRAIAEISMADLVIANGLGLEEGLGDILASAAQDGVAVFEVAPLVEPLPLATSGTEAPRLDPHFWMDPIRVAGVARAIADELTAVAPDGPWQENADSYTEGMTALDSEIRGVLATVANRKLVTSHESLGYFASRYGFEVIGVVVPGGSTLGDASSAHLADLVDTIRNADVTAIFVEDQVSSTLAEAVADEFDGKVSVVSLGIEVLGPEGSNTDSLSGILRENAKAIADHLGTST